MAYYNKIGLLILNDNQTKFLVCEPGSMYGKNASDAAAVVVKQYLIPGGRIWPGQTDIFCLKEEIKEELNCEIDESSIEFIAEYTDVSATSPDRDVSIKLYKGTVIGTPTPSSEIGALHWIGKEDIGDGRISPIINNKIIPDLISRGLLR
jgi:hypothetical protein